MMPMNNLASNQMANNMGNPMGNTMVNPIQKLNDELTLEMEHTWEKKKNEELKA